MTAPEPRALETESAEAFYSSTFRRLMITMVLLAVILTPLVWIRYHRTMGLSFAAGSLLALLNFYWLALTIRAVGAKAESSGGRSGSGGVILRFVLRYVLVALAAYAIFKGSTDSLYGLFAGLSLPVAAILIETVYQIYKTLRAGI